MREDSGQLILLPLGHWFFDGYCIHSDLNFKGFLWECLKWRCPIFCRRNSWISSISFLCSLSRYDVSLELKEMWALFGSPICIFSDGKYCWVVPAPRISLQQRYQLLVCCLFRGLAPSEVPLLSFVPPIPRSPDPTHLSPLKSLFPGFQDPQTHYFMFRPLFCSVSCSCFAIPIHLHISSKSPVPWIPRSPDPLFHVPKPCSPDSKIARSISKKIP